MKNQQLKGLLPRQKTALKKANLLAKNDIIAYTETMSIDRKKPLKGKELEELIERHKEAVASSACEGIHLTEEEEILFTDMAKQGLSYDDRSKKIDEYLQKKYDIPPDPVA